MERNGQAGGEIDRALRAELEAIMDGDGIVSRRSELKVYECDGWTIEKNAPDLLLMPRTTAQVSAILERRCTAAASRLFRAAPAPVFPADACRFMPR